MLVKDRPGFERGTRPRPIIVMPQSASSEEGVLRASPGSDGPALPSVELERLARTEGQWNEGRATGGLIDLVAPSCLGTSE